MRESASGWARTHRERAPSSPPRRTSLRPSPLKSAIAGAAAWPAATARSVPSADSMDCVASHSPAPKSAMGVVE